MRKRTALILLAVLLIAACAKAPPTTPVYEFHNAALNRYFRTANADEAAALRANPSSGEVDTGKTFLAYPRTGYPDNARPVCRFYGSVSPGPNSHFYTADPAECERLKQLQQTTPPTEKHWNFEEIAFAMQVPSAEKCPSDAPVPVYRVYNRGFEQGKDSNHRFVTDPALYQSMISQGWAGENIVMCAPKG